LGLAAIAITASDSQEERDPTMADGMARLIRLKQETMHQGE
jgi:hypothetical protein